MPEQRLSAQDRLNFGVYAVSSLSSFVVVGGVTGLPYASEERGSGMAGGTGVALSGRSPQGRCEGVLVMCVLRSSCVVAQDVLLVERTVAVYR